MAPALPGLLATVPAGGTHLQISNRTGKPVVVEGYDGEQFARILPDGTVQLNMNSPAVYLNRDSMGNAPVPTNAKPTASPSWSTQDRTGTYQWHDHRIHWMGMGVPEKVRDESLRTLVSTWTVPLNVGGTPVVVRGSLWWIGQDDGVPPAAIAAFVVLAVVLVGLIAAVAVRRRKTGI